jgi:Amt family ammonium transporter
LQADDSLDVFGVHGVGGIIGSLLTGVFASKSISGAEGSVLTQLISVGAVMIYSLVMTALLLWITSLFVGLRVSEAEEIDGLDITQHAERLGV